MTEPGTLPQGLVCPKCRKVTRERTSTNNGFCRPCDNIFGRSDPVTFTQEQIAAVLADGAAQERARLKELVFKWREISARPQRPTETK
jgi:ribosomal protein L37AE/L43A